MCHCVVVSRWLHPTQGDRRPSRSVGAITLLVFGGTAAAAVVLAVLFHLGVAPTVITVLVGGGAPAGVYLAYATYRLNADQASSAAPISTHPPTALAPDGGPKSKIPGDDSSGDQNGGQGTENNDLRAAAAITDSDKQVSAVLRLLDRASGADHRVMISWQPPESASMEATAEFTYQIDKADAEKIRWYLEDFAEFPDDSSFRLAADTEDRMSAIGRELFAEVLKTRESAGIWTLATSEAGGWARLRLEVDADPTDVPGLPWEYLRDPATDRPVALAIQEFVRTHRQAARAIRTWKPTTDRLRILLVICDCLGEKTCHSGPSPRVWSGAVPNRCVASTSMCYGPPPTSA